MLIEGNTILDGYCDNCFVSSGNRTGIHGIELGEPHRASISNIEIKNNTIGNNDGSGVYLNDGNQIDASIRINNNVLFNNTDSVQRRLYDNGATIASNDERSTVYFESFENAELAGSDFEVSNTCATNSTVAKDCSSDSLHGSCAVVLTVDGASCSDADVALASKWFQLANDVDTAASGWVVSDSSLLRASRGEWCLEFSDDAGQLTGSECREINSFDSIAQKFYGLPSIDMEPPRSSTRVRWVVRNTNAASLILDDIKITGVRR